MKKIINSKLHTPNYRNAGFGLIELLISLAVIGILVTMLQSNLGITSGRKSDATMRASFSSLRATARAYYLAQDPFSYRGLCGNASNSGVVNEFSIALQDLAEKGGGQIACAASDTDFAAAIDFTKEGGESDIFCFDSTGFSGKITEGGLDIVRIGKCTR